MPAAMPAATDAVPLTPHHLPDEIIQRIFQEVFEPQKDADPANYAYLPAPEYLVLSRRFYRLLRPIRYRSISTSADARRTSALLGRLTAADDIRTWLRKLVLFVSPHFTALQAFALSRFTNLVELRIKYEPLEQWIHVPGTILSAVILDLWHAITRLPRLARLVDKISERWEIDPHLPPLPSLKSVSIGLLTLNRAVSSLLARSGVSVLSLSIKYAAEVLDHSFLREGALPWDTLQCLTLVAGSRGLPVDLTVTLEHILKQASTLGEPPRLRQLEVSVPQAQPGTYKNAFAVVLDLAARVSCEELVCGVLGAEDLRPDPTYGQVHTLRSLKLTTDIELPENDSLADLIDMLRCMPNLNSLVLRCLSVTSEERAPNETRLDSDSSDLTFAIAYPHLTVLLQYLTSTAVRAFHVKSAEGSARWLRDDPSKPFERQAW